MLQFMYQSYFEYLTITNQLPMKGGFMARIKEGKLIRITFCTKNLQLRPRLEKAAFQKGQSLSKFIEFSLFKELGIKI